MALTKNAIKAVANEFRTRGQKLIELADAMEEQIDISSAKVAKTNGKKAIVSEARGKRRTQLHSFLEKVGPSSRTDILEGTSIPSGSLGALLSKFCVRDKKGLWQWKAEKAE